MNKLVSLLLRRFRRTKRDVDSEKFRIKEKGTITKVVILSKLGWALLYVVL